MRTSLGSWAVGAWPAPVAAERSSPRIDPVRSSIDGVIDVPIHQRLFHCSLVVLVSLVLLGMPKAKSWRSSLACCSSASFTCTRALPRSVFSQLGVKTKNAWHLPQPLGFKDKERLTWFGSLQSLVKPFKTMVVRFQPLNQLLLES